VSANVKGGRGCFGEMCKTFILKKWGCQEKSKRGGKGVIKREVELDIDHKRVGGFETRGAKKLKKKRGNQKKVRERKKTSLRSGGESWVWCVIPNQRGPRGGEELFTSEKCRKRYYSFRRQGRKGVGGKTIKKGLAKNPTHTPRQTKTHGLRKNWNGSLMKKGTRGP